MTMSLTRSLPSRLSQRQGILNDRPLSGTRVLWPAWRLVWSGELVDSGLAASEAADRVARELDQPSLKRPDRGVPPPRSGLPPLGAP
jgi:hypothetical protein